VRRVALQGELTGAVQTAVENTIDSAASLSIAGVWALGSPEKPVACALH